MCEELEEVHVSETESGIQVEVWGTVPIGFYGL